TVAALQAHLPTCRLLHIATHALFRPDNPLFSWLRLADQRLTIQALAQFELAGQPLVVLSACETGRGRPRGGGLQGLARTLRQAG
ncbi:MAG: CHAT domain-containing protein, partial [Anaerolineales bacterium]|nr:CHAT domain-containing protein [Anaerolineales bacterium]